MINMAMSNVTAASYLSNEKKRDENRGNDDKYKSQINEWGIYDTLASLVKT